MKTYYKTKVCINSDVLLWKQNSNMQEISYGSDTDIKMYQCNKQKKM